MSDRLTVEIARFVAEEVRRQQRGPVQVADMLEAWLTAIKDPTITVANLQQWGHLIEPTKNPPGQWRTSGVRVGPHVAPYPQDVPDLMERYVDMVGRMTPEEAYFEFEYVHPFVDGNGRVGKIVYNLTRLDHPVWPPNKWGISNP